VSIPGLLIAVIALVVAALCALADGALLAIVDVAAPAVGEESTLGSRDLTHRSLSIARLIAHVVAGVAAAIAFGLDARAPHGAVLLAIAIAVAIVGLGDLGPRAAGDALGARVLTTLRPLIRVV
jgi:hypothetical protein